MTYCKKHDVTWTGSLICHCEACGETFSRVSNFDAHRVTVRGERQCVPPAKKGMHLNDRGVWVGESRSDSLSAFPSNFTGVSE